MARKVETRTAFEKQVTERTIILEAPRQPGRDAATGRFVSNKRLPEMLPPYLIGQQMNITYYNDVDVEAFKRAVRSQVTRILDDIREQRFNDTGIRYQQFIDHYDACFEMPTPEGLRDVRGRGIDLYAILEHQGISVTEELHIKNRPGEASLRSFTAITDAHINLFFYMLELNLALHNQIESVQGQLRIKLAQLEGRLSELLKMYIYGDDRGNLWGGDIPASRTLYGWILLEQNNLGLAIDIYNTDPCRELNDGFEAVHAEVFKCYTDAGHYDQIGYVKNQQFCDRGLTNQRVQIAQKLCYYLQQIQKIHQYIDELTRGSDDPASTEVTVDIRSLLIPQAQK